ncbi:MAG: hypothetical protein IJ458_04410 [Clostridia bacterium]|nr:hypothetical protein [Clostridia bacterium]
MDKFELDSSLIKRRINDNLLKVKDESKEVKSLLSLGVQSTNPDRCKYDESNFDEVFGDINMYSYYTSRNDLLRTAIILGTSRNTQAQQNIMEVIRIRIGKVRDKDYKFIADLISLKNPIIVDKVNTYLCHNLEGYSELHSKYFKKYYGI